MKIGYPCINTSLACAGNRTFRLRNYSSGRLTATLENNLDCLMRILEYNVAHRIYFFRITSDLVPFASHPVCDLDWPRLFREKFLMIGDFIRRHSIRINMHPDQFTLLNSPDEDVLTRSIAELDYHRAVLDALDLDRTAKIQIHVGGVYGEKQRSMERFAERYRALSEGIRRRLVVENDHVSYSLSDCLAISGRTGIPVVFDIFHERVLSGRVNVADGLADVARTWQKSDGIPFVDYSVQQPGGRAGSHGQSLLPGEFAGFLKESRGFDIDVMLEIKDKEKSALEAVRIAKADRRFFTGSARSR